MTTGPAAERTGSPETEELVKLTQTERAKKRLAGNKLPPTLTLRRYAALLATAKRYSLIHEILASDDYSTVPQVYQEDYGIDAHADSDTVQKVLGNSRQKMQQVGAKVRSAANRFWDALCFYKEHESSLPAGLKTRYPLSLLYQWNFDLHELAELLDPRPFKLNPELDDEPENKAFAIKSLGQRLVGDIVYPATTFSRNQSAEKPLTTHQVSLLWWARFMRYPERSDSQRWLDMANLSYVWDVSDVKESKKKSAGKDPASLRRDVQRLQQQHPKIPDPFEFMSPPDLKLFQGEDSFFATPHTPPKN